MISAVGLWAAAMSVVRQVVVVAVGGGGSSSVAKIKITQEKVT